MMKAGQSTLPNKIRVRNWGNPGQEVDTARQQDRFRGCHQDGGTDFLSLSFPPNTMQSMCATWRSDNGVAQLWVDGKPTIKRFIKAEPIAGQPITILGQEQDTYGGGFDATQSFISMITKVHMWDSILPAAEIKRYMEGKHFNPGNVFNWGVLKYIIIRQDVVDDESEVM